MATTQYRPEDGDEPRVNEMISWANRAFADEFSLESAESAIGHQLSQLIPKLASLSDHQVNIETKRGKRRLFTYPLPAQRVFLHGTRLFCDNTFSSI